MIAALLFISPLEAGHSEAQSNHSVEWSEGHSSVDGHGDHDDHSALNTLQGHCDPGPDCSNSYAVFNSNEMTVTSSDFHSLVSDTVNLSTGRITSRDIPPPKRIS